MRIFKIAIWIILIALFGLAVYQDQTFFLSRHTLAVHIGSSVYQTAQLPLVVFFASFFLLGWLMAYLFGLLDRYRVGRSNKQLRATTASQQEALDSLKKEMDLIRSGVQSMKSTASNTEVDAATVRGESVRQPQ